MAEKSKKVGRPRLPSNKKAKPKSIVLRVPIELSGTFKAVISAYREGALGIEDIKKLTDEK